MYCQSIFSPSCFLCCFGFQFSAYLKGCGFDNIFSVCVRGFFKNSNDSVCLYCMVIHIVLFWISQISESCITLLHLLTEWLVLRNVFFPLWFLCKCKVELVYMQSCKDLIAICFSDLHLSIRNLGLLLIYYLFVLLCLQNCRILCQTLLPVVLFCHFLWNCFQNSL